METYIIAILAGLAFISLVALAGFAFWYFCVREEPPTVEDDPEAPLVAHLQKNVRVHKRPSRAALSEAGLQLTHFYLRSSRYTFVKALPEIGGRQERIYSLVRANGPDLIMALTPRSPYAAFPYHTESQQRLLRSLLTSLKHPFIAPALDVDFIPERDVLVTFRRFAPKGSLKDFIHKTVPSGVYDKKYVSIAKLPLERIALFGRQILEALVFMKERGFPYGHLHSGNVIIEDGACCLSDYENAFLNIEPERVMAALRQYPVGAVEADVLGFGLVVFEMAFGYELDSTLSLPRIKELNLIPAKASPAIKTLLEAIFSGDAKLDALMQNPFFANTALRDEHRFEIALANKEPLQLEPKAKDMLRTVIASYCITDIAAYDRAKAAPPPSIRRSIDSKKKKKRADGAGLSTSASSYGTSLGSTPSSLSTSSALSARSPPPQPPPRATPSPAPIPPRSSPSPAPSLTIKIAPSSPPKAPPKGPPAPPLSPPPPQTSGAGRGALLSSIQGFSAGKLKKSVTVDKSKPRLAK